MLSSLHSDQQKQTYCNELNPSVKSYMHPPQRPFLEEHSLGRPLEPTNSLGAWMLLLLCSILSIDSWQSPDQLNLAASGLSVFTHGQYWRLLLSPFIHADIIHLLANSMLFLVFGTLLKNYYGWLHFPVLSLMGAWATQTIALLFYDPNVRLIGASGMVYFMAGMWLCLFLKHATYLSLSQRLARSLAFGLVVLMPSQLEAHVSYSSHAIGFGLGVFIAWMSLPWTRPIPLTEAQQKIAEQRVALKLARFAEDEDEDTECAGDGKDKGERSIIDITPISTGADKKTSTQVLKPQRAPDLAHWHNINYINFIRDYPSDSSRPRRS